MKKIFSFTALCLLVGFTSCQKENMDDTKRPIEIKSDTPEGDDRDWIAWWEGCCDPEQCLGDEFGGRSGGVVIVVEYANNIQANMHPSNWYIYMRPQGSTGPYTLIGNSISSSYPIAYDLGVSLAEGCYEFVTWNSMYGSVPNKVVDQAPDLTHCC